MVPKKSIKNQTCKQKQKHHLNHLHIPRTLEELREPRTVDTEGEIPDKELKVAGEAGAVSVAEGVLLLLQHRDMGNEARRQRQRRRRRQRCFEENGGNGNGFGVRGEGEGRGEALGRTERLSSSESEGWECERSCGGRHGLVLGG